MSVAFRGFSEYIYSRVVDVSIFGQKSGSAFPLGITCWIKKTEWLDDNNKTAHIVLPKPQTGGQTPQMQPVSVDYTINTDYYFLFLCILVIDHSCNRGWRTSRSSEAILSPHGGNEWNLGWLVLMLQHRLPPQCLQTHLLYRRRRINKTVRDSSGDEVHWFTNRCALVFSTMESNIYLEQETRRTVTYADMTSLCGSLDQMKPFSSDGFLGERCRDDWWSVSKRDMNIVRLYCRANGAFAPFFVFCVFGVKVQNFCFIAGLLLIRVDCEGLKKKRSSFDLLIFPRGGKVNAGPQGK